MAERFRVACIPELLVTERPVIREKLLGLSDVEQSVTYGFQTTPFFARDDQATLQVRPATSFTQWGATFVESAAD